ncbi:MAG: cupin domain-containing protein [gamma proteobacterium symbiont of Lucinoma myriamae]|nr:cupin domain-containing protein [gamma proteobacterium symbiont of Lucinoma myriamae]MCU7817394.1 cupin domain-containing protein [gamma proteobacterium symbiont of Lucinoma myriamae]MCU7832847.1 cupin domain-containing protein [gamma proteobacterium symbiont of Lucinoma myriamae]
MIESSLAQPPKGKLPSCSFFRPQGFEPGWIWNKHVQPISETSSCHVAHTGYILQGRMVVKMDNGSEKELVPGDAFYMPTGHNAWVVGDEPCVLIDITGFGKYAKHS